jgi:cytochrome c553
MHQKRAWLMNLKSIALTAAFVMVLGAVRAEETPKPGAAKTDVSKTDLSKTDGSKRDLPGAAFSQHELDAKLTYCKTCHGLSGQGYRGAFPMPRLAGQQPEYLTNQLQAFVDRRRHNAVMFNVSHVLGPQMVRALAEYFKSLDPKPLGGAPRGLVAEGKKIYLEGSGANVPACASCHGPDAKGVDAFPRLAGQLDDYVVGKLTNWDKERGLDKDKPDNSAIMQPIAHELTAAQVKAVAAYLSYLE